MHKIQRISEFQHEFTFPSASERFDTFYDRFLQGDLGKIYLAVAWDDLVASFGLEDAAKGPRSIFSPKGKLALMFLEHWSGNSDRELVENLNGNLDRQFFCDLHLGERRISNFKIVSEIRTELSKKLDIDKVQQSLYGHWPPFMKDAHCI